jgi:phage shock protein C
MIEIIRTAIERNTFGVCARLGRKLSLPASKIRLYFIYISFITLGSPVIIYLFLAFWLRLKDYVIAKKTSAFEL